MKSQPDPALQPSQVVVEILAEVQRYSEAIGLVDLIAGLTSEADGIRTQISDLEADYAEKLRVGLHEIEIKLKAARAKADDERRGCEADTTRARNDLKVLLKQIEDTKAKEEDRVEDLRMAYQSAQASRKALAEERRDFEGVKSRAARSRR